MQGSANYTTPHRDASRHTLGCVDLHDELIRAVETAFAHLST